MIYLDNNATTQPAPEVVEAMFPFYREIWGNPSSLHGFGRQVVPHIDRVREQAAKTIGTSRASEIIFTSGGTEGDNSAIRGVLAARPNKRHIITTTVEHSAVLHCCRALEKEGYRVTYLPVDKNGALEPAALESAITDDTAIVSIMWANNETGVVFPVEKLANICRGRGVPFHTDAVQAIGKVPIDVGRVPVDLLSASGHKFHAPKGIGFLYIRRGTPFKPLIVGGGQEYLRRAGTENVAQIVGLGVACEMATIGRRSSVVGRQSQTEFTRSLRDKLERDLIQKLDGVHLNGASSTRVPNTTNLSIEGVDGESLILGLSNAGLCASTGSACSSGSMEPSHVLTAMKLPSKLLRGVLRLSLSRYTTEDEINESVEIVVKIVTRLRRLNP